MSDTYRRYRAIQQAIMQFYRPRPTGHRARHLNTLVALICGLVGGQRAHLSTIADHAPSDGADQESVIMRFRRWLKHEGHTCDAWFLPVAHAVLATLAQSQEPLVLVMDGSVVGRGGLALMLSVVYHGRALPLAWVVISAKKGHFAQAVHCALLAQVQAIMPPAAQVVFVGDGEFDGTELQEALHHAGWYYVCRTAPHICFTAYGLHRHVGDLEPARGDALAVTPAWMTTGAYGPISLLAVWEAAYDAPIYLVTNMSDLDRALQRYRQRAHIETFFSDQKSRGFHLHTSHLRDPARLSRLLIVSCLAYLWLVYLGVCALQDDWLKRLHRQDRCDLSLFRLGMRLLARCLKEAVPIPTGLLVPADLPRLLRRTWLN
jgi:hypothetical protein